MIACNSRKQLFLLFFLISSQIVDINMFKNNNKILQSINTFMSIKLQYEILKTFKVYF